MRQKPKHISKGQIQIIKIAQKTLGMSDDDYRALLYDRFRVNSCTELTNPQAGRLIDELNQKGFELKTKGRPRGLEAGRTGKAAKLKKIEALLADAKKPWSYADSLAKNICKVDKLDWVPQDDLYKIIAALEKQQARDKKKGNQK